MRALLVAGPLVFFAESRSEQAVRAVTTLRQVIISGRRGRDTVTRRTIRTSWGGVAVTMHAVNEPAMGGDAMADATTRRRGFIGSVFRAVLRRRHDDDEADLTYLDSSQVRALIEERARRELGMTAEEFFAAAERGELEDTPATAHLLLISGARTR